MPGVCVSPWDTFWVGFLCKSVSLNSVLNACRKKIYIYSFLTCTLIVMFCRIPATLLKSFHIVWYFYLHPAINSCDTCTPVQLYLNS